MHAVLSIINVAHMLKTQSRDRAVEFRCQSPADRPEFRCRRARPNCVNVLISRSFATPEGAETRFSPDGRGIRTPEGLGCRWSIRPRETAEGVGHAADILDQVGRHLAGAVAAPSECVDEPAEARVDRRADLLVAAD